MCGVILLAVYRPQTELLARQLDSIVAQTYRNWQCIVGIDGDGQTTAADILSLVHDDPRFIVHDFTDNLGHYRNYERLCELAAAMSVDWVAFADQDDYWYPDKLAVMTKVLERSNTMAVQCQARVVTESGDEIGRTHRKLVSLPGLMIDNQFSGSLGVISSTVLPLALPFPTATDVAYHDHWLAACALALGKIQVLDEVLQDYYQHDSNVIGEERGNRLLARLHRLRKLAGTVGGFGSYLAEQRWGWRVIMARELLTRLPSRRAELEPIARGRMNLKLAQMFSGRIEFRAPLLRTMSMAIGAMGFPNAQRSTRDR